MPNSLVLPELVFPSRFKKAVKTGGLILARKFTESHFDLGCVCEIKVGGKYLVEVCRNGQVIRRPFGDEPIKNLITNHLFDQWMGVATAQNLYQYPFMTCSTGTSATAAANSDIKLGAYYQYGSTLFTGGGMGYVIDTTVVGGYTPTLIYELPAAAGAVTLNEMGCVWTGEGAANPNITTHVIFPSGVSLNAGDNIRITYTFTITIPSALTAITVSLAPVNGFNISGQIKWLGQFTNAFGTVSSGGGWSTATNFYGFTYLVQANYPATMCSAPTAFPAINVTPSITSLANNSGGSTGTYTNGSFTRTFTSTWNPSTPSSTVNNVNGFALCAASAGANYPYLLLTSAQTKANTNTLSFSGSITCSRL